MQLNVWHIQGSSFHFGRRGLGLEESGFTFPSDSLFAALVARLAILKGADAVEQFVRPFQAGNPPFVLTSAYPRVEHLLFFPPPLVRSSNDDKEGEDSLQAKKLKRVRFVSEGVFRRIIAGESLRTLWGELSKVHDARVMMLKDEQASLSSERQGRDSKFWSIVRRPRVAIARSTSETDIFYTGQTVFEQGCGLWFGVQWMDKEETEADRLKMLFADLGMAGLGGERSAGFGACQFVEQGPLTLPGPKNAYWLTLSRYLPQEDEIRALTADKAAYALESVGGWLESPSKKAQRRRVVNLLAEGSVLGPLTKHTAPGQMVDVKPVYADNDNPINHAVWRNGLAVSVGVHIDTNEEVGS